MRRQSGNSAPASPPERSGLEHYRAKRDFARTPEPAGGTSARRGRKARALSFLVHKHAARRLHYDLRLELDGVLKSWAVPQGPSLDPSERRLAVHVEDHPLDYGGFEGTIPAGQYGAGTVMLWDRGSWTPTGDAAAGLAAGKLKFELKGERLRGGWTLVRMRGRREKGKDLWLLIKERDDFAREGEDAAGDEDRSVLSGLTMGEIGGAPPPSFVAPQLASPVDTAPQGQDWLFEIKEDGYRAQVRLEEGAVAVRTRGGHDWTARFSRIAEDAARLPARNALLDGEIVVPGANGVSSFARLKEVLETGAAGEMLFHAFDLLYLDGQNLRALPLRERKARLEALLGGNSKGSRLRYGEHLIADGPAILRHACRLGAEGIIAKRVEAPYRSGRGNDWLKVKCQRRQEFVILGYTLPRGHSAGLGSLVLGFHEAGELVHAGRVGTGWSAATERVLRERLDGLRGERPAVARLAKTAGRGVRWVQPELVAEVRFSDWTGDGLLRHASFQGLREDKAARVVVRERPGGDAPAELELCGVRISSARRQVLDEPPLTKGDIARYHAAMVDWILPHLAERPLSVIRCPDRLGEGCFFQRHPMPGMPAAIRAVRGPGGPAPFLAVKDGAGLLALVQFGAIELHVNGARSDRPDRPDRLVFDLDPGPEVAWEAVVEAAHELRQRLRQLGLESACKTTGGKGLHLVVPLERRHGWPEAKAFAGGLARAMQADSPDRFTAVLAKKARTGRIFIDYLRNDATATAVAAYSLRGRPGAPVAWPVEWSDVTPGLDPQAFTLLTAAELAAARADPWADVLRLRQRLPAGVGRARG